MKSEGSDHLCVRILAGRMNVLILNIQKGGDFILEKTWLWVEELDSLNDLNQNKKSQ